ncbi:protein starmaker-like isoform X2 [Pieris brassicae]|uniref:protein starmaker-like isoform X2 n=1 Tax=Pieris brassicae TaxID=7116 RepID=UPI001E65EF67|nr:protein starmaker-like isoform X2 [Pieris brassicae]
MSNIVTRKGPIGDDSKKHTDIPVKDMKKKMAVNAEKEKLAAEKSAEKNTKAAEKSSQSDKEKGSKKDKSVDKIVDKADAKDKSTDKIVEKKEKPTEKAVDKKDKPTEKSTEKVAEKKVDKVEKKDESVEKTEKKDKPVERKEAPVAQVEKTKEDAKENGKADTPDKKKDSKAKQNGARVNGEPVDGVSSEEEDDQMFPELAYEDSDIECFEPPTPEGPSRSYTRRSQSKETKLLKLKDDVSDRKLRSSDSPRRQDKAEKAEPKHDKNESLCDKDDINDSKIDEKIEISIEVESEEGTRKPDTNYSKSRVKVSPYRRSMRLTAPADLTQTSLLANYTGNNTTMEMDITEPSLMIEEASTSESPYLSGLRNIRGRRSYKPLKEMTLRNIGVNTSIRSTSSASVSETRPTGTVVGRKRKPDAEEAQEAHEARGKRARLLERLGGFTRPFRFTTSASERLCVESTAEIVGINTDLPLSAPVIAAETFDPESLKHSTSLPAAPAPTQAHRDKRCAIM